MVPKAGLPGTGRYGAVGFGFNGFAYIALGQINTIGNNTATIYQYDSGQNAWNPKTAFPGTTRAFCSTFIINNNAYICSGIDTIPPYYLNELHAYDCSIDQWSIKASLPSVGRYAGTGFSIGGTGYVATGYTNFSVAHNDLWQYTPSSGTGTVEISQEAMSIYPNPASDFININCKIPNGAIANLYAQNGSKLLKSNISLISEKQNQINIKDLPSGLYYILLKMKAVKRSG
ncbi:MAG: T9SS type A sorting domain-containing protein [Bacteroidetes bacterium]|nr:T9SS type A sorting domain-containing protein [Bacteroidota bacterium]